MEGHLERLRRAEIEGVRGWFGPGARVLEIGGGSGWQASLIQSWGCDVVSLDVAGRARAPVEFFPVQDYDGANIPYADASFDRIVSSNVLEHVRDLPALLAEMRRVLAPGGVMIHILPSPAWRLWTLAAHYPATLKNLFAKFNRRGARKRPGDEPAGDAAGDGARDVLVPRDANGRRGGAAAKWGSLLIDVPHGEYPNAVAELYYFSRARWLRVFAEHGFAADAVTRNGLFYTGHCLLPNVSLAKRRAASRVLGSACNVFVLRAAGGRSCGRDAAR